MSKFTKVSGVYKIVNQITGSFYIGSSKNIYTRMRSHLYLLRKNKHHSKVLQNQFNKYGESSLVMSPICFCDEPLLLILEQMYLDAMQPPCNTMTEVEASPMKGRTHPEEVHHLDFNRANNHPSNLLVLEKSQHTKLHSYLKYGSKEYKQCIVCNSQTDYTCCSSRCKALNKRVVKNRPTKEELLKLLTDHSYVEVGKMFKVSDNSIRKWLKSKNEE